MPPATSTIDPAVSATGISAASASGAPRVPSNLLVFAALGALWVQLFASCVPIWTNSEYYSYGWYVPPVFLLFFWRRWHEGEFAILARRAIPPLLPLAVALLLLPVLFAIRTLGYFDGSWRPPILLQAALTAGLTHLLLARAAGWRASLALIALTLFALSAVPHPYQIEQALIRRLTGWVTDLSVEWFTLMGRPVHASGERLVSDGTVIEVTQGCSGIRSFQSILMASLFFGELLFLRIWQRAALVVMSLGVTILVNSGRAIQLATIRFDQGEEAFNRAHDGVGMAAFAISAGLLLAAALLLRWIGDRSGRGKIVVRRISNHS